MTDAEQRRRAVLADRNILDEVMQERFRQDSKWGLAITRRLQPDRWLAVLVEEVGEVARASLEHDPAQYRAEMLQVAAVAMAAVVDLDAQMEGANGAAA